MLVGKCPIEECEYETPDVEAVVAAALLTTGMQPATKRLAN